MAKKGLGRGLNSLLGGDSYEEDIRYNIDSVDQVDDYTDEIEGFDGEVKIREAEPKKTVKKPAKKAETKKAKPAGQGVLEVSISQVVANPDQPRKNFSQQELDELADSIKRNGLLQPILVSAKDDKYEVIAGERRLRACKIAGLKKVPVIVKQTSKNKKLELALIENIQREDLNPMEEAYSYKKILDTQGISHSELASIVSKARSTITNSLRLLELPEDAQKLLYENKITAGHARAILSVSTQMGKEKLSKKIVDEHLSVREAESLANLYNGQNTKALTTVRPAAPKSYKKAAKLLRDHLGNNVRVKKAKGKNKIEIEFSDERDLERILGLIVNDKK
ncbi:MAG: ParB/RepB/Spo0J family partition protein [Coriobacteriia bacterium]|nr:ParB/RepB/Spo0J family partition protein [Coriobacteriia bacterium]